MNVASVLPPEIAKGLSGLSEQLKTAAGENLRALILYGGAARGRYHPGTSDVNLLVLLSDASTLSLKVIAPAMENAWREFRADPFILTSEEFDRAAEAFATKFIEIRNHHIVLLGDDPFATLKISPDHALARIEQELRNMSLRLRRRYLSVHESPELMYQSLKRIVVPLAVTLDAMLEVCAKRDAPAKTRGAILEQAAQVFELDADAFKGLAALRSGEAPKLEADELYSRVLDSIARAAERCGLNMRGPHEHI